MIKGKIAILFCLTTLLPCFSENKAIVLEVDTDQVLTRSFIGVGVQWSAYPWFDVSDVDWDKVFRRVDYMKLPFTRVMVDLSTFFEGLDDKGEPRYIFNGKLMNNVYKLLDYCEDKKITVLFGHWGWTNTALTADSSWAFPPDSPMHARLSADLIEHLLIKKGYTCIKWFDPINEPDGHWSSCKGDLPLWSRVVEQLDDELEKRELRERIQLSGPGTVYHKWLDDMLGPDQIAGRLGSFNQHYYIRDAVVSEGKLEGYVRQVVDKIEASGGGKPFFAGEVGFLDGKLQAEDQQPNVKKFWYGVSMADAAVQMMRGGMSGLIAWDLDDAMHWKGDSDGPLVAPEDAYARRKIWGFWNIVGAEHGEPEDENLRPWFYVWSLLSRLFPQGCEIIDCQDPNTGKLRVAAAKLTSDNGSDLSIAIVNRAESSESIKILIPGYSEKISFRKYDYVDSDQDEKVDSWSDVIEHEGRDILPAASEILEDVNPASGLRVQIPPRSVMILSTIDE